MLDLLLMEKVLPFMEVRVEVSGIPLHALVIVVPIPRRTL
jgi:hypothetical protein